MGDPFFVMEVREVWTEADFETMGWHDASVYSISFHESAEEYGSGISFDIDYLFKWVLNEDNTFSFWVSPCTLFFPTIFGLQIDIESATDWGGTWIQEIDNIHMEDAEEPDYPGLKNFHIELQTGDINFQAYGFVQTVRKQPVLIESQDLGR